MINIGIKESTENLQVLHEEDQGIAVRFPLAARVTLMGILHQGLNSIPVAGVGYEQGILMVLAQADHKVKQEIGTAKETMIQTFTTEAMGRPSRVNGSNMFTLR